MENWYPIHTKFGLSRYEVSDLGNFRNKKRSRKNKNTKIYLTNYFKIYLYQDNGKRKYYSPEVLVAETFIGSCPSEYHFLIHKDGNKSNNAVCNLEYVHKNDLGNFPSSNSNLQLRRRCIIEQCDSSGNVVDIWYRLRDIQKFYGNNISGISMVLNGRMKTSKGYIWRYSDIMDVPQFT